MTDRMPPQDLRDLISSGRELNGQSFRVLRELFGLTNSGELDDNTLARELTIRILDARDELDTQYQDMLTSLLRAHGLFPYIDPTTLSGDADLLAYEAHRPEGLPDEEIVFHAAQAAVYYHLLDGRNVILSAPTSFGKSLIIDALIASGKYNNVVICVPTLALIDETRRRLAERFGSDFKVVTHPSQGVEQRNLFVYTQERVVEQEDFPPIDLFVIDEFYKLDSQDEGRTGLLNQALYRLLKTGSQFYFLGPNVEQIAPDLPARFNAQFVQSDLSTVAIDVNDVGGSGPDLDRLVTLCRTLTEPTLIYCQSPRQARDVARALFDNGASDLQPALGQAVRWISENYDPEWLVGRALTNGIGIHHGRIPRALSQFMVRAFNRGDIKFLVCTSTLIEGVNTAAKNVIIYSNRIARQQFDFFTFNNIRGRSGRMFRHFIGRVFLFHPPPAVELPHVDVPAITQPASAPSSLLVQIDPDDLTTDSKERMRSIFDQQSLSLDTIKESRGISPELQIAIADDIRARSAELHPLLAWSGFPSWDQLRETSRFVWRLSGFSGLVAGVSSGPQLAFKLNQLRQNPETRNYIRALADRAGGSDGDERVESALEFVRQWAGHHAPRLFLSIDRIQREVFSSLGNRAGNYAFYVGRLQNLFLPAGLAAVDEYGLPVEIGWKIRANLTLDGNLDDLIASVRRLRIDGLQLSDFEKQMIVETQQSLGPTRADS